MRRSIRRPSPLAWPAFVALFAVSAPTTAERMLYGEDCQTAMLEGSAAIPLADLESDPLALPIDVCARATADVTMEDEVVRMEDVEVGFHADPGQSLTVDLFERDSKDEPPSLTAELLLLDFAFLLQQTGESLGSPSGSQFDADFTAEGKLDFEFTGELAPKAGPVIDAFLTNAYGEPLFPASEFREETVEFIEIEPAPTPKLLVDLLYMGPFDLLGVFTAQIAITAPRPFELTALGPAPPEPPVCDPAPRGDCIAAGSAKLSVKEKKPGSEKLSLALKKLATPVTPDQFGNPVTGASRYDVCVYDGAGAFAGGVGVDQAGDTCGKKAKACWKDLSGRGFKYADGNAAAGVTKLTAKGGDAGKGKLTLAAANKSKKGQNGLPTGTAAALAGATSITAQVVVDDGACFGATLTQVKKADGLSVQAKGP